MDFRFWKKEFWNCKRHILIVIQLGILFLILMTNDLLLKREDNYFFESIHVHIVFLLGFILFTLHEIHLLNKQGWKNAIQNLKRKTLRRYFIVEIFLFLFGFLLIAEANDQKRPIHVLEYIEIGAYFSSALVAMVWIAFLYRKRLRHGRGEKTA
jgi:hypothetical protein